MPPAGFKPSIPASDRPQTFFLDRSATGIGKMVVYKKCGKWGFRVTFKTNVIPSTYTGDPNNREHYYYYYY